MARRQERARESRGVPRLVVALMSAMKRAALVPLFLLLTTILAACTTPGPTSTAPTTSGSPREVTAGPRYNLSGYSESFKQGYGDACASPSRRNDQKFKADTDYQLGWNDGRALCKK